MDVFSSTLGAENKSIEDVIGKWSGTIAIVGKKSDQPSKEDCLILTGFYPSLFDLNGYFRSVFNVFNIARNRIRTNNIIQIALDKVVGYQAMSTLMF